jgi:hypothetical protein
MNLSELQKILPEAQFTKDNFGADYLYIPSNILSKRRAWNMALKRGFIPCLNKQYLMLQTNKESIYLYNSSLKNYLSIEIKSN